MVLPAPLPAQEPRGFVVHRVQLLAGGPPSGPIYVPLAETDIGEFYRGDTVILPVWEARDYYSPGQGQLIDLTDATVWLTAKTDLSQGDADPSVIRCTTANGAIAIINAPLGQFQVVIDPHQTNALLDDTVFVFDVQVRTGSVSPRTVTVKRGTLTVIRDVTRATA